MINDNYYSTADIGLSSTLLSLGFILDCLDKTNPQKVLFIFKRTPDLDQVIESYWSKRLVIEPQNLLQSLKMLKNRIYSTD